MTKKNFAYGLIAFALVLLIMFTLHGCTKSTLSAIPGHLVASSASVKVNQQDTLLLAGASSSDSIRWSVTPAGSNSFATKLNGGLIWFSKAGTYTVSASDNGATPATVTITVTGTTTTAAAGNPQDTVAKQPTQTTYTQLPLTGDQITLVPYFYQSTTADSSYLKFVAQTRNFYCGTSTLVVSTSFSSNSFAMSFIDVSQPSPCAIGSLPIAAAINYTQNPAINIANGTYPLSVTLNGTTYTGSVAISAATVTFNWNYTSGVLISPMQISR